MICQCVMIVLGPALNWWEKASVHHSYYDPLSDPLDACLEYHRVSMWYQHESEM